MNDPITLPLEKRLQSLMQWAFGGEHHLKRVTQKGCYWELVTHGDLSTFDSGNLTALVLACSVLGLRAQIEPHGPRHLKILVHGRNERDGSVMRRIPSPSEIIMMLEKMDAIERAQMELEASDGK